MILLTLRLGGKSGFGISSHLGVGGSDFEPGPTGGTYGFGGFSCFGGKANFSLHLYFGITTSR